MSVLEKELQQMEAQYGEEFGDASDSDEVENSDEASGCSILLPPVSNVIRLTLSDWQYVDLNNNM